MPTGDWSEESAARRRLERILSVCFNSLKTLATEDIKTIAGSLKSDTAVGVVLVLHAWKKKMTSRQKLGLVHGRGIADAVVELVGKNEINRWTRNYFTEILFLVKRGTFCLVPTFPRGAH